MTALRLLPPSGDAIQVDGDTLVGRDEACQLVVDDRSVSRHHARLERRGVLWFVVDQGSANGTFLDGRRVTESALRHGQELRFGERAFRVELPAQDTATTVVMAGATVVVTEATVVMPAEAVEPPSRVPESARPPVAPPATPPPAVPTPPPPPATKPAPPTTAPAFSGPARGASLAAPPPPPSALPTPPPLPAPPAGAGREASAPGGEPAGPASGTAAAPSATVPLPAPVAPWGFQPGLAALGDGLVAALRLRTDDVLGRAVERMIRGALLDGRAYRAAAAEADGTPAALGALAAICFASAVGALILFLRVPGPAALVVCGVLTVVQVVGFVLAVAAAAWASGQLFQTPAAFGPLLRALAYAQSPRLLSALPLLGQFLGLWSLVSTTAAVREVTGIDTGRAVLLMLIPMLVSLFLAGVLSPLLLFLLA